MKRKKIKKPDPTREWIKFYARRWWECCECPNVFKKEWGYRTMVSGGLGRDSWIAVCEKCSKKPGVLDSRHHFEF